MSDFRTIRSRSHPFIRRLRALGRDSRLRRQEQVYLAEGVRWAEEALRHPRRVAAVLVSPRLEHTDRGSRVHESLRTLACERYQCPDALLDAAGDARTPQGVLLLLRRPEDSLAKLANSSEESREPGVWLVVFGVQDPGNLGGLARTARALGAAGLVCGGGADLFHPRAVRASAGALLDLHVAQAADEGEMVSFLGGLQARAALPRGGEDPRRLDWSGRVALVLGGEAVGLPPSLRAACAVQVSVPMRDGSESLNVAAAAAALLALISSARAILPAAPGAARSGTPRG